MWINFISDDIYLAYNSVRGRLGIRSVTGDGAEVAQGPHMRGPEQSFGRGTRCLFGISACIAVGAFLFLSLFVFPNLPIWRGGDQTIWLSDAERMLGGEVLYRDFFQMTFPATHVFYLSLFKLFGPRTWIPDLTLGFRGIGLTVLIYRVSRKILPLRRAPIPALFFLTLIFHEKFDATHHWFSFGFAATAVH